MIRIIIFIIIIVMLIRVAGILLENILEVGGDILSFIYDLSVRHRIIFGLILYLITGIVCNFAISTVVVIVYSIFSIRGYNNKKKEEERAERERQERIRIIKEWEKLTENEKRTNIDDVIINGIEKIKNDFCGYYDYCDMVYGRAVAFLSNFIDYSNDNEIYFFKPERTINPYEVRENGLLIARTGVYYINEWKNAEGEIKTEKAHIDFGNLFKLIEKNGRIKKVVVENENFRESDLQLGKYESILIPLLNEIIEHKIPQIIRYKGYADNVLDCFIEDVEDNSFQKATVNMGVIAGGVQRQAVYNEQKNYMNGAQGHGYAAEYANLTRDEVVGNLTGKEVINEAQNLDPTTGRQVKDGADRIFNGEMIQTKYYTSFSQMYREVFPDGHVRYQSDGKLMRIEVPRDSYLDYKEALQKKIDAGELHGIKKGTKAEDILCRGAVSYAEALNIAKAGTIEGLLVDGINGVITSTYASSISMVIIFAKVVWTGRTIEEAARAACEVGFSVLGKSTMIYIATMQLTRSKIGIPFTLNQSVNNPIMSMSKQLTKEIQSSKLAKTELGKQLGLKELTEKTLISNTVTAAVVFGPDIYKFFSGKISGKQLMKNSAVGLGGIAGGVVGDAILGATLGPIGIIAGGIIGSMAAKKVMDKYVEDDAIQMFVIYKEEFLDVITTANLSQSELDEISQWTISSSEFPKFLEVMYSKENSRGFARTCLLECVENIYSKRKLIENSMIEKGYVNMIA